MMMSNHTRTAADVTLAAPPSPIGAIVRLLPPSWGVAEPMIGSAEQRQDILGRFCCQAGVRCRADFLMKRNDVPHSPPTAHDGGTAGGRELPRAKLFFYLMSSGFASGRLCHTRMVRSSCAPRRVWTTCVLRRDHRRGQGSGRSKQRRLLVCIRRRTRLWFTAQTSRRTSSTSERLPVSNELDNRAVRRNASGSRHHSDQYRTDPDLRDLRCGHGDCAARPG